MRAAVGGGCALLVWWLSSFVAELWFWFWWQSWSLWEVTGLSCDDTLVEMVSFYQSGWDAYAARYGAEEDDKDYPLPGGSKRLSLASFAAESATYRGGRRNQPHTVAAGGISHGYAAAGGNHLCARDGHAIISCV